MLWKFMETEWFVPEVDNWHIKDGAPKWVIEEFNEWKKLQEDSVKKEIMID